MTQQEFIDNNNMAVAITFVLRDLMEGEWVKRSAFFDGGNVKTTLMTRERLNRILNKVNNTQRESYVSDMVDFALIIENFGRILLEMNKINKQAEFVMAMQSLAEKLGMPLLPEHLKVSQL